MKEGWEYKKLGEIASEMYRGSGIRRDQVTKEGTPCVRYGEIYTTYNISFDTCASYTNKANITSPKYFEHGDLLFAITGESVEDIGKTIAYLGHEKCLCGGDIICMKHKQNPKYLAYALSTPDAIRQKGIGKTKLKVVHTNAPALKAISIPLAPLSEQQRIVDYLDAAFAKIDAMKANAEKALNEAKALFQASLKEMLEPKEGWEEKKLKDVVVSITDGDHQPPPKSPEGIPFITISNIDKNLNKIVFEDTFYVPQSYFSALKEDRIPQNGDVLYTVTGSFGIPVLIDFHKNFCFQRHIALIRPNNGLLSSTYLFYWILSTYATSQAEDTATGAAQRTVSLKSLRNFKIHIPPLSEQQRIVATLDSLKSKVDRLQANFEKISQECDALKQAILRQIFE